MGSRKRKTRRYSTEYVGKASGVAWYDREQGPRWRQGAADPERLEETYEEWIAMAEQAIHEIEATGMLIERVPVDTEELIAWCNEQGRPIDGAAGAEFAGHQFRKLHLSD